MESLLRNRDPLFLGQSSIVRTVTGTVSASVQQVGSSVYSVYGTNFYGPAYSVPLVVISSSIQTGQLLVSAPTIATIDENNMLTVNWQPYQVNGTYSAYRGWNITLRTPPGFGTPVIIFNDGLESGGH